MAGPFKLRSGNGPLKFKNMGSSPVKHEGKIKTVDSGPPDYKVTGYSHVNEDGGVSTAKTVAGLHKGDIPHSESVKDDPSMSQGYNPRTKKPVMKTNP